MRTYKRKKPDHSDTQHIIPPQLQSSLFVTQASIGDLPTLQNKAEQSGFNFGDIAIFAPNRTAKQSAMQAKLTIGEPGDKYEREADAVAAQVVHRMNSPQQQTTQKDDDDLQRKTSEVNSLMRLTLQRDDNGIVSGEASQDVENQLNRSRGGGQSVDASLGKKIKQHTGWEVDKMRIHTDANADKMARSVQARAFTTGSDVFFKQGEYQPNTSKGQELIVHEFTHGVHQGAIEQGAKTEDETVRRQPAGETIIQLSPEKVWGMTEDAIDRLATRPKQAQKILRDDFYSNWFIAKDYLVEGKWQGKSRTTIQEKQPQFEKLMRTLLRIRQLDTNTLLMHIRDVEFTKDPNLKRLQPAQRLTWSAAGSETLTSDIDVNLKGAGSIQAVGLFNKLFKTKYGWSYDPGTVYDVNVYAQDFMTPGADRTEVGGHIKLGKPFDLQEDGNVGTLTPVEETNEIMDDLGLSIDAFNLNQDVWSLVKMRIYMSDTEWNEHKHRILGYNMDLRTRGENPEAFARREQMKAQIEDAEYFYEDYQENLALKIEEIKTSSDRVYVKMRQHLRQGREHVSAHHRQDTVKMMAANLLYEEKLEKVQQLRTQLQQLQGAHPRQDSEIKMCAIDLKNALSEATIYANEAYLTQGAVHFSVVGYQIAAAIEAHKRQDNPNYRIDLDISREAHLHSMREQVGDTLKVFHEYSGAAPWKAAYKAGKYIDRLTKSATPLIPQLTLLHPNFQADFHRISQIGEISTRLKAQGRNSVEQQAELTPFIGSWTVDDLRNIIICLGRYSEQVFRPQIIN